MSKLAVTLLCSLQYKPEHREVDLSDKFVVKIHITISRERGKVLPRMAPSPRRNHGVPLFIPAELPATKLKMLHLSAASYIEKSVHKNTKDLMMLKCLVCLISQFLVIIHKAELLLFW